MEKPESFIVRSEDCKDYVAFAKRRLRNGRLILVGVGTPVGYAWSQLPVQDSTIQGVAMGFLVGLAAYNRHHRLTRFSRDRGVHQKIFGSIMKYPFIGKGGKKKLTEKMTEHISGIDNPLARQSIIISYLLKQGRFDDAFLAEENFARLAKEYGSYRSGYDMIASFLGNGMMSVINCFRHKTAFDYIGDALGSYREHHYQSGRTTFLKAMEKFPEKNLELCVLAANIEHIYGNEKDETMLLHRAVRIMKDKPEFQSAFFRVGEQRNETLMIKSRIADGVMHVKRGKDLKHEHAVNKLAYRALLQYGEQHGLGDDFACVARSLGFINGLEGFDYHFTRRNGTENLEDELLREPERADELLMLAIDRLARFSAVTTQAARSGNYQVPVIGEYDYAAELKRRLIGNDNERIGDNPYLPRLRSAWLELLEKTAGLRRKNLVIAHCDAGPKNILPGGTVIDFEKVAMADPTFDTVTIAEIPGSELEQRHLDYLLERMGEYGVEGLERGDVTTLAMINAAHNAMCQFGNNVDKGNKGKAAHFLERARERLRSLDYHLSQLFEDYAMHSAKTAEVLG
ncbi:MAG TPA: phosphotransferase [Candidatus Nanoarchaeia archaeon]|nr:phosphotransferase [Candidatus Nanoarchaeia archaeon]